MRFKNVLRTKRRLASENRLIKSFHYKKFIIGLIVTLCLGLGIFSTKNFLQINEIDYKIDPVGCADSQKIKSELGFVGKDKLFLNTEEKIDELKKKYKCIESVKIEKNVFGRMSVTVRSRIPVAVLYEGYESRPSLSLKDLEATSSTQSAALDFSVRIATDAMKFLVDRFGFIYSQYTQGLDIYEIGLIGSKVTPGHNLDKQLLEDSLLILSNLKNLGLNIKTIKVVMGRYLLIDSDYKLIFVVGKSGTEGTHKDVKTQLATLQLILQKAKMKSSGSSGDLGMLEYIDLRYDKPIVRYSSKK